MKILLDMNLSPALAAQLCEAGWESIHWSSVGDPRTPDCEIFDWAQKNGYWVITNDLDFGAILAATNAQGPSVIQFRIQNVSPSYLKPILLSTLEKYKNYLESGALISVDERRSRVRILPLK